MKDNILSGYLKNLAIASAVVLCGSGVARAATQYGTGSLTWDDGLTAAWGSASGGAYDTVWTNGNDAVFEGTAGTVSIGAAGVTAQNLTFNTDGFTVQNSTLTLSGTPVLTAGANATISANIAGDAGLTKAGSANLTLLGTNTYSGSTSVSAGILQIGNGTVNPSLNAATYTIGANSTLYLYSASFPNGQQSYFSQIAGSGLLEFNTAAPSPGVGVGGDYAGVGSQWYPNFGSGFTGTLQLDRGRMPTQGAGSLGGITSIIVKDGAQLGMWNGGTFTQNFTLAGTGWGEANYESSLRLGSSFISGNVTLAAGTTLAAAGTATLSGVISGASTANLSLGTGAQQGTLVLTGTNTYTGTTTINTGALQLGNGGTTGALSPASTIADNGTLTFNRSDTVTQGTDFGVVIAGSGGIVQAGSGTLVLNNMNNYSGATTINGGTLKLAPLQTHAFRYYRFHVTANNGNDAYNQISELHFYSNGVWKAAVGGSPTTGLNNGENHWSQSNDNNQGTKFGQAGVPYDITYDFGSPQIFNAYNWATANDSTPTRNPAKWMIQVSNNGSTWATLSDMTGSVQSGPSALYTWAGTNSEHYLAVAGNDGAAYAYPLDTKIDINVLPVFTPVKIAHGATLDLNGVSQTIVSLVGDGNVTNSASTPVTLTINQTAGETNFNGSIADSGSANAISVLKSGTGTMKLAGNNTYTGSTVIETGTLKFGAREGFRYYKFQVNSVYGGGDNGLQYSEMAFYSNGTNPNNGTRVFPVTATGDGGQYADQGIPGLYDGNTGTKSYMGTPFPRFVTYDFGTPTKLTGYDWASANDMTPARNPNDWTVLGSNDGSAWTTLDTQTGAGATPTDLYAYAAGWPISPVAPPSSSLQAATSVQIAGGAVFDLDGNAQSIAGLSGSGLVTNGTLLTVNGTIAPGGTNVIGTLTVATSAALAGTLQADVANDGSSDLLAVQGNLDLSSGISLVIANPNQLNTKKRYTLITYTGTRTGKFASVTVPDSRWRAIYPADGSVQLMFNGGTLIVIE